MSKVRYQVTKEQVERLVENFVMEAAAPEATKHIKGSEGGAMVEKRPNSKTPSKKDWGRNDEKRHAAEAKKHIKGDGGGSKQVEERPNTPNASEVDPGTKEDELSQAKEAKKHVKGSVAENRRRVNKRRKS